MDPGELAGGVEPGARSELAPQDQQLLIRKLCDLEYRAPAQAVPLRQHGQDMDRSQ